MALHCSVWMAVASARHLFHGSRGFLECVVESRTVFSPLYQYAAETLPANAAKTIADGAFERSRWEACLRADGKLSRRGVLDCGGFLLIQSRIVFAQQSLTPGLKPIPILV